MFLRGRFSTWWAQPERDIRWLHGLLDDGYQMLAQSCQVYFLAQGCTESCQRPSGIILASIETAVNNGLNAVSQALKESCNDERGDHDGDITILVDDATHLASYHMSVS